uniref:HhH-GPD domain-containing protein n=2 Tax=Physcomitrium patens TaxID=3218 RepID=A0A2K1KG31_PHYPA|nr:DNA-3-methyladenine glycosylase 1-like [Physcomitrium patens]PNR52728.1 hypothetical protein PHYPA_009103 [Physcomitrium patens]|eukprot:XP_024379117.1 DNA-3-methyladenine glycosylase 1-like [Physcomitrella patens]
MRTSGPLSSGGVGRVLRSHTSKALPVSKITLKVKTGAKKGNTGAGAVAELEKKHKTSITTRIVSKTEVKLGASTSPTKIDDLTVTISDRSWTVTLSSADAIAEATKHLLAADANLACVIQKSNSPPFENDGNSFAALVRSIVSQQLAVKAAATIHARLVALCGGPQKVTPAAIAALTAGELRGAGISGRKEVYLHDLADKLVSGALSDEKLMAMEDEDDLVTALTAVKGIGVWSAHMFMIFHLHRPDVLPVGDLGIRKGFQKLFHLKHLPCAEEMHKLADSWRPYRSLASWYLWQLKDATTALNR